MKKLKKLINDTILCIRFPFLYPRNRWTGKHQVNALGSILFRLYKKSFDRIIVTAKLESSEWDEINRFIYRDKVVEVRLNKYAKTLTLNNGIDENESWNYSSIETAVAFLAASSSFIFFIVFLSRL